MSQIESFFDDIMSHDLVVVDVYKQDCEPCKKFLKIFDRAKDALEKANTKLVKYDIADVPDLKMIYDLTTVPTFLYFRGGELKKRYEGINSIVQMVSIVNEILKGE